MKSVFISIIDFNGQENTINCLRSIESLEKVNFKLNVIVVNNYPQEKLNLPKFSGLNLKMIENKENLGFAGGHNIAIKNALENGADYILVLNNDTIVNKSLITELLKSSNSEIGIIVPKIYFAKGHEFHKTRYKEEEKGKIIWYAGGIMDWENVIGHHRGVDEVDNRQYDTVGPSDFASGCCMLVKREVFEKVGFFDERYFLYYEDNDLSQRALRSGFKILYQPKAILWHKNAGSAGGSGSLLQDYYITRNRMLFGIKFAPLRSKASLVRESIRLLLQGRSWQKKGILDFYFGNFGKGSYE